MADIHILESKFRNSGSGSINIVFHVPNNQTQNNFPGGITSVISGLTQTEIDNLSAGSLYEEVRSIKIHSSVGMAAARIRIRSLWQTVANEVQGRLNEDYKFYGETLAKA